MMKSTNEKQSGNKVTTRVQQALNTVLGETHNKYAEVIDKISKQKEEEQVKIFTKLNPLDEREKKVGREIEMIQTIIITLQKFLKLASSEQTSQNLNAIYDKEFKNTRDNIFIESYKTYLSDCDRVFIKDKFITLNKEVINKLLAEFINTIDMELVHYKTLQIEIPSTKEYMQFLENEMQENKIRLNEIEDQKKLYLNQYMEVTDKHNNRIEQLFKTNPLLDCCQTGNLDKVKKLIEEQGNWNRKTYINNIDPKFNLNALHIACAFGKTAIVNYLLFQGADTEIPDKNDGYYPLHHAVESGCLETLIALQNKRREKLGRNAILTVKAVETQRTPLHSAAFCNYPEMAEWLINQGVDVNCQEKVTGYTALHTAAYRGNREIINVLLDNAEKTNLKVFKQNANKNKETALLTALLYAKKEVLLCFMEHGYCLSKSDIEEVNNLVKGNSNLQELLNIIKSSFAQYTRSLIPFNPNSKFLITTEPTKAILENIRVNATINVSNRKESVLIDNENLSYERHGVLENGDCGYTSTKGGNKQLVDDVNNLKISDKGSLTTFENKQSMNNNPVMYPDKKIH